MSAIDNWTPTNWATINGGGTPPTPGLINTVMGKIRVLQTVFPTVVQGTDTTPVPGDTVDPKTGIASAGLTKPVVTITKSFQVANAHVQDPALSMVMSQVTLAAQSLALAEDMLFFQGETAKLPSDISVASAAALGSGLLGRATQFHQPIQVAHAGSKESERYGTATLAAVVKGLSEFAANGQAKEYALILDPATYADANLPLQDSAIITPASAIQALLGNGMFAMSPGLPAKTGLLVSLGGATTTLYIGTGPVVNFIVQDTRNGSDYHFNAAESIQFNNIDPRSLIKLEFGPKK
jgi:uncharacterized linocin/CFP29 family protein